jgi:flagellar biosynthetic protein FliR
MFSAPFFSTNNVPRRVKTGLSIFIAFLVYLTVVPHEVLEYSTIIGYAILVVKEAFC